MVHSRAFSLIISEKVSSYDSKLSSWDWSHMIIVFLQGHLGVLSKSNPVFRNQTTAVTHDAMMARAKSMLLQSTVKLDQAEC